MEQQLQVLFNILERLVRGIEMTWWNANLGLGVSRLQLGIASTMIAVQMCIENMAKRSACQVRLNEGQCLLGMGDISRIDQCGLLIIDQQNVVRG